MQLFVVIRTVIPHWYVKIYFLPVAFTLYHAENELPGDKINKMICAPSDDSDQPGHLPSLTRVFTVRMKKAWVLSYPLNAQRRLIRLGGCPGWSESSLGTQVILLVLSRGSSLIRFSKQHGFWLGVFPSEKAKSNKSDLFGVCLFTVIIYFMTRSCLPFIRLPFWLWPHHYILWPVVMWLTQPIKVMFCVVRQVLKLLYVVTIV